MALANRVLVMRRGNLIQDAHDAKDALEYYINDIVGDKMTDQVKEMKLKKILHFEM